MQDWSHYGKGYVRIKAYTQSPERFLNLCDEFKYPRFFSIKKHLQKNRYKNSNYR